MYVKKFKLKNKPFLIEERKKLKVIPTTLEWKHYSITPACAKIFKLNLSLQNDIWRGSSPPRANE